MIKLHPLTQSGKDFENYAVIDIEARNWTDFVVLGFYDGQEYREFNNLKAAISFIFSQGNKNSPKILVNTVFAHFGGKYDFLFFINEIIEMDGYEILSCIPRGSSILCFDVQYNGNKISFRDTSAFLPFSLDNLTTSFGVDHKKQKFDFNYFNGLDIKSPQYKKQLNKLREYLRYDCIGLFEVIKKYSENALIKRSGLKFTTASQALNIFRSYIDESIPGIYGRADEYIRKAYFGGRTEIFKPLFDGPGKIHCYDINSLYPSVLSDPKNEFPGAVEGITDKIDFTRPGFYWCDVFVPEQYLPPLPYLHKGKLLFPCGYLSGIWSVPELCNAIDKYGVQLLKVRSGYKLTSIGNPFAPFINDIYERRQEAKAEGDAVMDIICKLTMNSLYGRFGLRKDRENFAFDENQKDFEAKWLINKKDKNIRLGTIPIELNTSYSNIAIAAYTTSYARIINLNTAQPWAEKHHYYTDTDSFLTTKKLKEGSRLGELKLEYSADQACFLLPKTYIIKSDKNDFEIKLDDGKQKTNKKIVMNGFNSRKIWREFDMEHFKTALHGDLSMLKINNEPKFATFKRALQKNKILTMLDAESRKINSTYSKREIYKNSRGEFDTRPLIINKNGEIKNGKHNTT